MKEIFEGWIARDKRADKLFCFYNNPPKRGQGFLHSDVWICPDENTGYFKLPRNIFEEQKWEDEPRKVKITIETTE